MGSAPPGHWKSLCITHLATCPNRNSPTDSADEAKNDSRDAEAIWTAVQQPGTKTVAVKTEEQQGILALHRMRQQLVKFRTAQINALRGLLTEYGEVMPRGRAGLRRDIPAVLERVSERLPAMVVETLREQWARVGDLDAEVDRIERRLTLWHRQNVASRRIAAIPGVGVLSATAVVATMGDPAAFRSGREFAAWLGLVPRHTGTGGRVRMLGISKRGDRYLRTLLIHGARSVLARGKLPSAWQLRLSQRRPSNVVAVALANKMARTIGQADGSPTGEDRRAPHCDPLEPRRPVVRNEHRAGGPASRQPRADVALRVATPTMKLFGDLSERAGILLLPQPPRPSPPISS